MLKKIREFTYRYSIVSSILISILFVLLVNGAVLLFSLFPKSAPVQYAEEIFLMLCSVGLVLLLGNKSTFKSKGLLKGLICGVVVIVFMIFSLSLFFINASSDPKTSWASTGMIIFGVVQAISIGVREECFFRGAIQNILGKKYAISVKGVWFTAFIGALFFALIHLLNIFAGYDPVVTIFQTLSAICSGFFFAAIYLRSNNIWASILIHALVDAVALAGSFFLTQSRVEVVNTLSWESLLGTIVYILPAIFLLRPSKCKEIIAHFEAERKDALPSQL